LWGEGTEGLVGPKLTKETMDDIIRAMLKEDCAKTMDEACYYGFVHPEYMKSLGLLKGGIGHYESVRGIKQPMITAEWLAQQGGLL